jgi:hypothetical protein
MAMTVEQVVDEARGWPADRLLELVERLTLELPPAPELEAEWAEEVRQRITEIATGQVQGIPGETVSARIGQIVGR